MTLDPKTRQQLLELVYDLLPQEEAVELRERIATDAEVAAAYDETRQTAELLAEAARLQAAKIKFKLPEEVMNTPSDRDAESAHPKPHLRTNGPAKQPWGRAAGWVVGLAALILVLLAAGEYWWHRHELAEIAAEHLRMVVAGPAKLQSGVTNQYVVTTSAVTGEPVAAQVEFAVYSPDGSRLLGHKEKTDEEGRLLLTIPASLSVPSGARLEVLAVHQDKLQRVDTRLAVEPVRYATQLALDKPLYQPGETVYYRSLTLSRFGLAAEEAMPIEFEILDPGGAPVGGSRLEGVTERGVGNGTFEIPGAMAGGEYTLVVRSLDGVFPEEKRPFFIRSYRLPRLKKELEFARDSYAPGDTVVADFSAQRAEGGPAAKARLTVVASVDDKVVHRGNTQASDDGTFQVEFTLPKKIKRGDGQLLVIVDDGGTRETMAKTIPINLGKVEVSFYPEGGDLVAGLENRVYFVGRDPLGEPVHVEGKIIDSQDNEIAEVETVHEGMGSFSFKPRAGEPYRLKIENPAGVKGSPKLPKVSSTGNVVLTAGVGVFDAGQPLEFNVRASKEGLPLVAAAWCRGVPVGQQWFTTERGKKTEVAASSVSIPLAEEVAGVIRLTIYDYTTSPPKPVAERLVYRRPGRQLHVSVGGHSERYSPGETVNMSLLVTDEKGEPVPATLGVAVTDDALLSLADDDTPKMPTHFFLTTEVENPEDLEDTDFYLSDDPEAPVALDLLLGTQGWRRFVEKTLEELKREGGENEQITRLVALGAQANPPAMFDNLGEIRDKYQASLATYQADRTRALKTLTTVSFFGGVGLVLLVLMLVLMNIASGLRVWVPALGAATVCLIVGAILMNPDRLKSGRRGAVAFAPFSIMPPEALSRGGSGADMSDLNGKLEDARPEGGAVAADEAAPPQEAPKATKPMPQAMPAKPMAPVELRMGELKKANKRDEKLMAGKQFRFMDREKELAGKDIRKLAELRRKNRKRQGRLGDKWEDEDLEKELQHRRFVIREYAHKHVPGEPGVRSDFTETVFWHPMLIADADGRAEIKFDLSDAVTTFRVQVDAHGDGGRIGTGEGEVISRIPFNLEPKLPLEVNAGDVVHLPLAVVNDTKGELPVALALEHGELVRLEGDARRKLELLAEQRSREYFVLTVTGEKGDCPLTFRGTAGHLADAVKRSLKVVPPGFPKNLSYSGRIDGEQELVVDLPEHWVPGSLEVTLSAFPSALADLQQGMDGILREPCGCFEQASTSNYPNVLALQYMEENDVANPAATRRAKELLKKGYAKLVGYECKQKGYEWFGGDPGHEALTAYGLMEFRDMARVYDVDAEMIKRTAEWLLDRRDGRGGFKRNAKALDSFGRAPEDITNAYVTWALSESGQEGIDEEIKHVAKLAEKSDDPYLVALAASSLLNAGKTAEGKRLLEKLAKAQHEDGHLEGTAGSITRSGGISLKMETTALAALAWLKLPAFTGQANRAIEWIVKNRQGSGGFGSTQATILALKSLVEHAKANRKTLSDGKLIVKRDDQQIGEHAFGAGQKETVSIDGLEANLRSGKNELVITLTGNNKMPYALDVSYKSRKPANDPDCAVELSTRLDKKKVKAGETAALSAELVNKTDAGKPMTVAILGLPAGLEPRPEQLEELKKAGNIDYYETRAREVICYWRSLAPKKKIQLKLDLVAAVPGRYTGPASRAYLYYTAEQKHWSDPLSVEITKD